MTNRDWHILIALAVVGMLSVICFGIFAAAGGLGPSKSERLDRLEQRVTELENKR